MTEDHENKSYWKLGIFYFNPENEKVFVPKRFGIGRTLNFARWQTHLIMAVIVILVAVSLFRIFN